MTITPKNIKHPQNDKSVEQILGFNNNLLIKDLFEILNEVLANRDISTYRHTMMA